MVRESLWWTCPRVTTLGSGGILRGGTAAEARVVLPTRARQQSHPTQSLTHTTTSTSTRQTNATLAGNPRLQCVQRYFREHQVSKLW